MQARRVAAASAVIALSAVAGCGGGGSTTVNPADLITVPHHRATGGPPMLDNCVRVRRFVDLRVGRGSVRAGVVGHGDVGVAFANQIDNSACTWPPLPSYLAAHGIQSIVFDYGRADDAKTVLAAGRALERLGARKLVFIGSSLGGPVVLHAAASHPDGLAALVALSPVPGSIPYPTSADVRRLRSPALYITAAAEASTARALYAATGASGKRLVVLPGALHGTALLASPQKHRVLTTILRLIRANT